MKKLLEQMRVKEAELDVYQEATEFWLEGETPNHEKSEHYEKLADDTYEELYKLFDLAAEKIVSITAGQIDKITAMRMVRCKRAEVERIFA